jgi:hypothetical protein
MGGVNNSYIFDTNQMILMVPNLKRAQKFLLDKFFPGLKMSDTEFVSIDVIIGKRRMSPFVSPLVEGKMVEQLRVQTNIFKPPYIKDKRAPDLRRPIMRQVGERIGGEMSGAQREQANLVFEMEDQVDMLERRMEWMAAQVLAGGTLTVSGEGFPTTLIDYGRSAALTIVKTGTAKWGTAANFLADGTDPVPTKDVEHWQRLILKASGAKATDIVFTTTPWELFLNATGVKGVTLYDRFQSYGNKANPGAEIERGAVYKGKWGQYDLWLYNDWYVDDNNIEQPMLTDGTVIMSGPDLMGLRAHGQILDPAFSYAALPFAPKTWVKEDPAQRIIMMQSSPLVIPGRPNASVGATVCDPVES